MSYNEHELRSSLVERIESLYSVARNLESAFHQERAKAHKLFQENLELKNRIDSESTEIKRRWEKEWNELKTRAQEEVKRIQSHYQQVIREMEALQNGQRQREEQYRGEAVNAKMSLRSAEERLSELQQKFNPIQQQLVATQNELQQFRAAWVQVLKREEDARKAIALSEAKQEEVRIQQEQLRSQEDRFQALTKNQEERIESLAKTQEEQIKVYAARTTLLQGEVEKFERMIDHYQRELKSALYRAHEAEAKNTEITSEIERMRQSSKDHETELKQIEDSIREQYDWKLIKKQEELKAEFEKDLYCKKQETTKVLEVKYSGILQSAEKQISEMRQELQALDELTMRINQLESLIKLKDDCLAEKTNELKQSKELSLFQLEAEKHKRKSLEIELQKLRFDLEEKRESFEAIKSKYQAELKFEIDAGIDTEKKKMNHLMSSLNQEVEQLAMIHPLKDIVDLKEKEIQGLKEEISSLDADDPFLSRLKTSLKRSTIELKEARERLEVAEAVHAETSERLAQEPVLYSKQNSDSEDNNTDRWIAPPGLGILE